MMLVEGLGVETDVERGVEYLCRASDAGSAQAHYELVRVTGNASWRAVHGELMTVNVAATTCGLGDFSDRVRNGSGRLGIRFPAYTFTTLAHHSHHPTRSPLTPPHSLSITLRKATLLYCGTDVEEDEEQVRSPLTHSNPHSHSLTTQTHTHTRTPHPHSCAHGIARPWCRHSTCSSWPPNRCHALTARPTITRQHCDNSSLHANIVITHPCTPTL